MRERHSRRVFLGVGLGCTAPLLLGTAVADAAGRVLTSPRRQGRVDDPIGEHLRREALRTYRDARSAVDGRGRINGESLRDLAACAGLLEAYLAGNGRDASFDAALHARVDGEGRDAAIVEAAGGYDALRRVIEAQEAVALPTAPAIVAGGDAMEFLQRKGLRRTARLLRQWSDWEARDADRAAGRASRRPTAGQKPGDDFGGYPEPNVGKLSCDEAQIVVDVLCLAAGLAALAGQFPLAEILAVMAATAQLGKDMACTPLAT